VGEAQEVGAAASDSDAEDEGVVKPAPVADEDDLTMGEGGAKGADGKAKEKGRDSVSGKVVKPKADSDRATADEEDAGAGEKTVAKEKPAGSGGQQKDKVGAARREAKI
jgi:hypothetical protein